MLKKFDSYRTPAAVIAAAALAVGVLGSTGMRNLVVASGGAATETGPGEQQAPAKKFAPPPADEQKRLLGEIDEATTLARPRTQRPRQPWPANCWRTAVRTRPTGPSSSPAAPRRGDRP